MKSAAVLHHCIQHCMGTRTFSKSGKKSGSRSRQWKQLRCQRCWREEDEHRIPLSSWLWSLCGKHSEGPQWACSWAKEEISWCTFTLKILLLVRVCLVGLIHLVLLLSSVETARTCLNASDLGLSWSTLELDSCCASVLLSRLDFSSLLLTAAYNVVAIVVVDRVHRHDVQQMTNCRRRYCTVHSRVTFLFRYGTSYTPVSLHVSSPRVSSVRIDGRRVLWPYSINIQAGSWLMIL